MKPSRVVLAAFLSCSFSSFLHAENRSIDGTGNHPTMPMRGAANTPVIRFGYDAVFADADGAMITEPQRPNARDISNALSAQSASVKNARGLSDLAWAWGQFLAHDMGLTATSNGPEANGTSPIAIHDPLDPLGPNPIPFTRSNFVDLPPPRGSISGRTPINEVTSYIDASNVYGSDAVRAAALRTDGGTGAKLLTSANNLLPYNTAGLPNENRGFTPAQQLFLAGDIRANEHSLLTSLHTIFAREHNRLVDIIADQQPEFDAEQQFQLARKIVGAQMQIITYNEFLPALLGDSPTVPRAEQYAYSPNVDASVTNAFAHATFRFGHSMVSPELRLVADDGATGSLSLRNAFFNPSLFTDNPQLVEQLLRGAAMQRAEEVDTLLIDDLRNFLFGPPGAGGLDLAALNIERGRDVGLPSYIDLRGRHQLGWLQSFSQITSDAALAQALSETYDGNIHHTDAWVGALAEDHVPGASVGPLIKAMLESQFRRLRDGDRLFYLSDSAGLYTAGQLSPEIAAIIDLDNLTLADVILANTAIVHLQSNVFFVPTPGDYNGDGFVDAADYTAWRDGLALTEADYHVWKQNFGAAVASGGTLDSFNHVAVPESASLLMLIIGAAALTFHKRFDGDARRHRS